MNIWITSQLQLNLSSNGTSESGNVDLKTQKLQVIGKMVQKLQLVVKK